MLMSIRPALSLIASFHSMPGCEQSQELHLIPTLVSRAEPRCGDAVSDAKKDIRRRMPDHPDVQLLRELAAGRRPMAEVIDADVGVNVAYAGPTACAPDEGCLPRPRAEKLCDQKAWERLRESL